MPRNSKLPHSREGELPSSKEYKESGEAVLIWRLRNRGTVEHPELVQGLPSLLES